MDVPFWLWMVREGCNAYRARERLAPDTSSVYDGPVWCFDRFGMTRTELPDGRTLCVGGEHEDSYDPDFCIYNDLVVLGPGDAVAIYGYPEAVFPPTDFHTATLVGDALILIGSLGYGAARQPGITPVYCLDTRTYTIEPLPTEGAMPGWISRHDAEFDPDGGIVVRGGQVWEAHGDRHRLRDNLEEYRLDLATGRWEQLTDRRQWRQIAIHWGPFSDARELYLDWWIHFLRGTSVPYTLLAVPDLDEDEGDDTGWRTCRMAVKDVPVTLKRELDAAQLVVEGALPEPVVAQLVADIQANLQRITGKPCRVEEL
jgi:hypothetical protein